MATMAEIAALAGVSVPTVSRALHDRGDLSPATRARVRDAARELGYRRTTRRGRPAAAGGLLDLVLGGFDDPWSDEVTAGARVAAAAAGFDLVLTVERDVPEDDWPQRIRRRGSAGVVLGLISPTRTQLAVLHDAGIPAVLLDPRGEDVPALPSVRTTDEVGGRDAAAHLLECGIRRFALVSSSPPYRFGRARIAGFLDELSRRAPDAPVTRVDGDWSAEGARRAAATAIAAPGDGPLGVFAIADHLAAGVYAAAAEAGVRIPDDVQVIGFDDVRIATALRPALSTVRQPIREMATAAVGLLVRERTTQPTRVELPTRLIARESTRMLPPSRTDGVRDSS